MPPVRVDRGPVRPTRLDGHAQGVLDERGGRRRREVPDQPATWAPRYPGDPGVAHQQLQRTTTGNEAATERSSE